jgi:hypothetical protein
MHSRETYEACMAQESAENRIQTKLADLREEVTEWQSEIRAILESVKRQGFNPSA